MVDYVYMINTTGIHFLVDDGYLDELVDHLHQAGIKPATISMIGKRTF